MASSSNDPDSLVTLHFHDFRVERMRHWWTLLGEDDHADIVGIFGKFPPFMRLQVDRGLLEALASFWDPTHCCFSIGEVDLVPTLEEYAELPSARQPLQRDSGHTHSGPSVKPMFGEILGFDHCMTFQWSLLGTFIAGKRGMEEIPNQCLQDRLRRRQGEGVPMFCTQLLQLWFCSHLQHFYRLQTPYHFERHTVTWGPAAWMPWTHCALFDGVPLPGVWGCTGYYPSLALRQFGGVQYPPRLGDLDAVTFDYIPGEDMWRLLFRIEDIWGGRLSEMVLIEEGASYSLVSRSLRVSASTGQPERVTVLERELEEARAELSSLRLARASEREESAARVESMRSTLHHNSVAAANLRRDLEAQRGNVSTLRAMNEFIREQLEISEDAKDQLEETLAETREQLETEQVERTRVRDELDSLRSYTQALVDPTTGRPQDIVALRRALDASEEALTSARTSMGAMRVQISVLQALHQINQVMDSLGARARAVLEEHDEGDPALSTALGRFCRETCIRLGQSELIGDRNSSPSISARMIAPPEKAFFTTYGPSYDGANFPRGSDRAIFLFFRTRISGLESARSSLLVDSQRRDLHFDWQYCFHPIYQRVGGGSNRCPHLTFGRHTKRKAGARANLYMSPSSCFRIFFTFLLAASTAPFIFRTVGSIVGDEHFWHSVTADDVVLHKPGDRDLSDILEGTCLHPLGKIVDGYQYELMPVRRLWGDSHQSHPFPKLRRPRRGHSVKILGRCVLAVLIHLAFVACLDMSDAVPLHCQPVIASSHNLPSQEGFGGLLMRGEGVRHPTTSV
uniref:DUF7745 domain-containing protein n=1 Tax=Fagus sylvatica TaxID=28930 RepID=A0A2N9GIF6_FAGSY